MQIIDVDIIIKIMKVVTPPFAYKLEYIDRVRLKTLIIKALKYKHHLLPSLYSCLFIWDNSTTVDTAKAQEPSIYIIYLY